MKLILALIIAAPTLVSAQSYYQDPYLNQAIREQLGGAPAPIVVQQAPSVPIVQQNTYDGGTTTTTGINPYTGQMWSNTIQPNGYTYGTTTNGNSYQDNIYQKPVDKMINNFAIQGMQNLGAQIGGAVYDSTEGE